MVLCIFFGKCLNYAVFISCGIVRCYFFIYSLHCHSRFAVFSVYLYVFFSLSLSLSTSCHSHFAAIFPVSDRHVKMRTTFFRINFLSRDDASWKNQRSDRNLNTQTAIPRNWHKRRRMCGVRGKFSINIFLLQCVDTDDDGRVIPVIFNSQTATVFNVEYR